MNHILYKETQYFYSLIVIMIIVIILLLSAAAFFTPQDASGNIIYIMLSILFIAIMFLFYKLEIIITNREAILRFGIGLVNRKIAVRQLHLESTQLIKTTLLWGIGYRFTPHGTLFNTRVGTAIHIKTKNNDSEFFVVTSHTEAIKKAIKTAQSTSNT